MWGLHPRGRRLLWLMDNESARFFAQCCVFASCGFGRHPLVKADLEISLQALRWYERVPTVSNLADDPSRLCLRMSQHLALLSRTPTAVRRLSGLPVQSWPTRECPIERHQVRSECASRCITWLRDLRRCVPRHASQVRCCFKYRVRIRAAVT